MRIQQIAAVVAAAFAVVEVRTNRAVEMFAIAIRTSGMSSYLRLHQRWQLLLGTSDTRHTSFYDPTGGSTTDVITAMRGGLKPIPVNCSTKPSTTKPGC